MPAEIANTPGIVVIAGPTASGKSSLALETAEKINGEIVSIDSMQLYRAIPIGTAQPTLEERARIRHHLVGIYEFSQRAEVYSFIELADQAINDILARGKVPVLCGGTGLYLRSLLYGLDSLPGDEKLKAELDAKYDDPSMLAELQARLIELGDRETVEKYTNNRRRLIRALEVRLLTGRSILELQGESKKVLRYSIAQGIRLEHDREVLIDRIAKRAKIMLKAGWIEEAQAAFADGILESPTAHQALGYKLIKRYVDGEFSLEKLEELLVTATWQYARRQQTWFRHQHPELNVLQLS